MSANVTIRLSPAQYSALQCAGLWEGNELDGDERVLSLAVVGSDKLVVSVETQETIARAINELSNSEDAMAEQLGKSDPMAKFAARAARSLATLYGNVLRARV